MAAGCVMQYDDDFFDDLEADLAIDKHSLEREWLHQPQLYIKYAMASAYFAKVASEEAEKVKVLQANLEADAAEDPEACLGEGVKATADRIKGYAVSHPEMAKAKQDAIDAKWHADMALSAVFSMQQRKDALEQLVRLQGMEPNSSPQAKDSYSREMEVKSTQRAATDAVKNKGLRQPRRTN